MPLSIMLSDSKSLYYSVSTGCFEQQATRDGCGHESGDIS
ncbi:hypothetical protein COO91_07079 [Nostoc flagelliforme CCNUN1]|uniref:Uncharacterized protein n=1 Tax=Nostoc flagelliforme CCNUN1 TaxID=2038116 RepID=A0A2K8T035_9NOSO|nr:hypothetical protein COO91_07079 [Nostoc flagelliforme CCNUN1]